MGTELRSEVQSSPPPPPVDASLGARCSPTDPEIKVRVPQPPDCILSTFTPKFASRWGGGICPNSTGALPAGERDALFDLSDSYSIPPTLRAPLNAWGIHTEIRTRDPKDPVEQNVLPSSYYKGGAK